MLYQIVSEAENVYENGNQTPLDFGETLEAGEKNPVAEIVSDYDKIRLLATKEYESDPSKFDASVFAKSHRVARSFIDQCVMYLNGNRDQEKSVIRDRAMGLFEMGWKQKEISDELGMSTWTIRGLVGNKLIEEKKRTQEEVRRLYGQGMKQRDIADAIGISPKTVFDCVHKNDMYTKTKSKCVYFIQEAGFLEGAVKIGVSYNPERRLKILQTGNPRPLRIIALIEGGGKAAEADLHKRFANDRMEGEWFQWTPELGKLIDKINDNTPLPEAA